MNILIAEDEHLINDAYKNYLERNGFEVVKQCFTTDEVLDYFESGGSVDIIIIDHRMPGKYTGLETARIIKNKFGLEKIILASADMAIESAAKSDNILFFLKPFKISNLLSAVKDMS